MNVAILDDGIDKKQIGVPIVAYSFLGDNDYENKELSHGTICAKIIEKYGNIDTIFDIKILNSSCKGNITTLINALKYCLNLNVSIINLSIGIESFSINSDEYRALYKVCKSLKNKSVRIIASQSNSGIRTIPADFDVVDSVEDVFSYVKFMEKIYRKSDYYTFSVHLIKFKGKYILTERCNSFACAYMTAISTKRKKIGFIQGKSKITSSSYFYNRRHSYKESSYLLLKDFQNAFKEKLSLFNSPIFSIINKWTDKEVEIPVIEVICCSNLIKKNISFVINLRNQFVENGYIANIVSTIPSLILYDIDFFPQNRLNLISLFKKVSNSDVIILLTDKRHSEWHEDISIWLKLNSFYCIDRNGIVYKDEYCNSQNLFNFILNYYGNT